MILLLLPPKLIGAVWPRLRALTAFTGGSWGSRTPPSALLSTDKAARVLQRSSIMKCCAGVISPHLFRRALVGFPLRVKHKEETNTVLPLA